MTAATRARASTRFTDAVERRVDYATVNDRFFVNNVSLGVYATIVQQEGYRDAKAETTTPTAARLLGQREEPFDLQFVTPDGDEVDGAFLIMVSNNPYVLGPSLDVSQRRRLDTGRLGVFAVSASTGAQAAEVVTLALAGKGSASGSGFQFDCDAFEVRSRSGKAYAGIDGEALELETPLRFRAHPGGLRMLVPEGNIEAAFGGRPATCTCAISCRWPPRGPPAREGPLCRRSGRRELRRRGDCRPRLWSAALSPAKSQLSPFS